MAFAVDGCPSNGIDQADVLNLVIGRTRCASAKQVPAAFVSNLFDWSHSWYAFCLKIVVHVQGTYTPFVIRYDMRTRAVGPEWRICHSFDRE